MALHISILNIFVSIVILLHNWKVNRNSAFLAALLFLISLHSIIHYLVIHASEPFWLALAFNNLTPLMCLIGPALYLYVRSVLTDRTVLRRPDLLHLIPFLITLIGVLPYLFSPFEHKLSIARSIIQDMNVMRQVEGNWLIPQRVNLLLRPFLQVSYAVACLVILVRSYRQRRRQTGRPPLQYLFVFRWLVALTVFVLSIGLYNLSSLIIYYIHPSLERQVVAEYRAVYLIGAGLICAPFLLFIFPSIIYGIPRVRMRGSSGSTSLRAAEEAPTSPSGDNTGGRDASSKEEITDDNPFAPLSRRILECMEEQQPYLDPEFSLDDLAEQLDVPKHHLYYCFRNILNTRFTTLRTEYRIKHAKKLLGEIDLRITTLEAVGRQCGFATHSSFYKTFKAEVGCSPGEFVEKNRPAE